MRTLAIQNLGGGCQGRSQGDGRLPIVPARRGWQSWQSLRSLPARPYAGNHLNPVSASCGAVADGGALRGEELVEAEGGEVDEVAEALARERFAFGRGLNLD